jgi:hypothetical protein
MLRHPTSRQQLGREPAPADRHRRSNWLFAGSVLAGKRVRRPGALADAPREADDCPRIGALVFQRTGNVTISQREVSVATLRPNGHELGLRKNLQVL